MIAFAICRLGDPLDLACGLRSRIGLPPAAWPLTPVSRSAVFLPLRHPCPAARRLGPEMQPCRHPRRGQFDRAIVPLLLRQSVHWVWPSRRDPDFPYRFRRSSESLSIAMEYAFDKRASADNVPMCPHSKGAFFCSQKFSPNNCWRRNPLTTSCWQTETPLVKIGAFDDGILETDSGASKGS